MAADIDAVMAKLRATADALKPAVPVPVAPPVAVEVVGMPARCSWLFTISRGPDGAIASVLAEPVE